MPESKIKSEVISRIRVYHKVQVVSRDEFTIKSSVVSGERIKNLSELPSSQNKEENTNSYLIHSDHEIKKQISCTAFPGPKTWDNFLLAGLQSNHCCHRDLSIPRGPSREDNGSFVVEGNNKCFLEHYGLQFRRHNPRAQSSQSSSVKGQKAVV